MEFDSSVTQDDIDASGLGAAQGSFGSSGFSSDQGDGTSEEDFNSFVTNLTPQQAYTMGRGAKSKALGDNVNNPFPESIFSRIFGPENVDYTDIIGGGRAGEINELRFRQAMGLPSRRTGQPFEMGDFYIGQPTLEGTVKEVPRGGIISLIPGIGTIANILGRNRGLPEGSEAYKKAMAEANKPVFQPLTDIINSMTSGIGAFIDRFRSEGGDRDTVTDRPIEPRGTELGDMTTTNAFIPDARVVVDNFNRPLSRTVAPTFPSDMNQVPMLRAGITSMQPNMSQEADMEVADALQLIPSNLETNPIAPVAKVQTSLLPSGVFSMLPTAEDRRTRDFTRDVFASSPNLRQQQFGRFNQDFINRTLNPTSFDDTGTFINLDNI